MLIWLFVLAAPPALAWDHMGFAWTEADWPLEWNLQPYEDDPWLDTTDQAQAVQRAFDAWQAAVPCLDLQAVRGDDVDLGGASYNVSDRRNTVTYGDPVGSNDEGQPVVTFSMNDGTSLGLMTDPASGTGLYYAGFTDSDIVFGRDLAWTTLREAAGGCDDAYIIETAALHGVGHLLGLAHSCEASEELDGLCDDEQLDAAMYWEVLACDAVRSDPTPDDADGLLALYGPFGRGPRIARDSWSYTSEICLSIEALFGHDESIIWSMGDGSTQAGREICHTYAEPGAYTVGVRAEPGGCEQDDFFEVLACDQLAIPADQEHAFSVDVSGSQLRLQLGEVTAVPACIQAVQWGLVDAEDGSQVDQATGSSSELTAPSNGQWTVEVTVIGLEEELHDTVTVTVDSADADADAEDGKGGGCSTSAAPAAMLALLAPLLALRRRYPQ